MCHQEEIVWRPVNYRHFGEVYEVSSAGEVRRRDNHSIHLRPALHKTGYYVVSLCYLGRQTTVYVHRIVALTFLANPAPDIYTQVGHADDCPLNNSIGNLYWTNAQENNCHGCHIANQVATVTAKRLEQTKKKNRRRKPVWQIIPESITGATVVWYSSLAEADRMTGVSKQDIRANCLGIRPSAGGYQWVFALGEAELNGLPSKANNEVKPRN